MTICLVTDRRQLSPDARTPQDEVLALARWLEEAVAAGVDLIQLRERDLPPRRLRDLAAAVMGAAAGSKTRVVVNDRADVAIAAGCDGVHLRGDGPPVDRVRELVARPGPLGPVPYGFLIGRSVHAVEEARVHASADYLLFGAVYRSGSKPGLGLDALRRAVQAAGAGGGSGLRANSLGVIAIGGVDVPRAAECVAAGAAGVAAIRLFLPPGRAEGALGTTEAVTQLRGAFDPATTRHLQ